MITKITFITIVLLVVSCQKRGDNTDSKIEQNNSSTFLLEASNALDSIVIRQDKRTWGEKLILCDIFERSDSIFMSLSQSPYYFNEDLIGYQFYKGYIITVNSTSSSFYTRKFNVLNSSPIPGRFVPFQNYKPTFFHDPYGWLYYLDGDNKITFLEGKFI